MHFWLAYSGGLDSTVLLHLLVNTPLVNCALTPVHIHHGLSPQADDWQQHCEQVCAQWQLPLTSIAVEVKANPGDSIEALARQARYRALAELMQVGDCLLTAHHQDDQAETVLLQLLRGAGVKGLAGMPSMRPFAKGVLYRPLLGLTRQQLQAYADDHRLAYIHDPSNQCLDYDRNFLRHHVLPKLRERWPAASQTLARSSRWCAQADALLTQAVERDFSACYSKEEGTLRIRDVMRFSLAKQREILRYWLQLAGFSLPNRHKIHQIVCELMPAKPDAKPLVTWDHVEVRRYRGYLYAMIPLSVHDPSQVFAWDGITDLSLPLGKLTAKALAGVNVNGCRDIQVRFRTGGERFKPQGYAHSRPLKKWLQDWHVLPWCRDRIPLIYINHQLVCVVGYWVADGWERCGDDVKTTS